MNMRCHFLDTAEKGFTLLEIIIVIGLISFLYVIVLFSVNPSKNLSAARNAARQHDALQLQNALYQYLITTGDYPTGSGTYITSTVANAPPICKNGVVHSTCVDLSALVPRYLAGIPQDPSEPNPRWSGYKVYFGVGGKRIVVYSTVIGPSPY